MGVSFMAAMSWAEYSAMPQRVFQVVIQAVFCRGGEDG
jgi:hypothetical protein